MALDPKHGAFTAWAKAQGVLINGVTQSNVPGKGFGIVATRKLKKGETIVSIPASTLITHDSDFVRSAGVTSKATVYGAVAAALALNHSNPDRWYATWQATWPSREDFEDIMPLCWTEKEQQLLPQAAKDLLRKQQKKYEADVEVVCARLKTADALGGEWLEWYRYYWLIVNTRCFYWVYFKKARDLTRRGKKLARDECLALVPWGDYFNHEDTGCLVTENATGATIITNQAYAKGEEVVVSYGAHSNDYLLVEYGFILESNKHDHTTVDHIILPLLDSSQQVLLEEHGYLREYYMTTTGFCYRTQVAVRMMVTPARTMSKFLAGEYDGSKEDAKLEKKMQAIFDAVFEWIDDGVEELGVVPGIAAETSGRRWRQLKEVANKAYETAPVS